MGKQRLFFDGTPLIGKYVSGVGKVLQETLRALDTKERADIYEMYIFLPCDERGKVERIGYKHIKVKYLPYPHKFLSLFSRMQLSPPLDIFLGKGIYIFENFRNWNLLYSKSITYIHDVAFMVHPEFVEKRNLEYLRKNIGMWVKRTDVVVTVSKASSMDIKEQLGVDAKVIPNGVWSSYFKPCNSDDVKMVLKKWELPSQYYLFIGNIEPRKNLENTIKAFSAAANPNESLVLVGGGGWMNEGIFDIANSATDEGATVIHPEGYVPDEDLPALITGAKALVHFPWYEGSGLPILQAIACGVPVAASSIAPLKEVVGNIETGVVFADPNNIEEMSTAMVQAAQIKHNKKGKVPISWMASADELTSIIEEL